MNMTTPVPLPARPARPPERTPTPAEAVETAWLIHAILNEWTHRVDSKASFALTLEAAALATAVGLASDGGLDIRMMPGPLLALFVTGLLAVLTGALCAMMVVFPRMRVRDSSAEADLNFIYFGHLRHWTPEDLQTAIATRDPLPALSRQLTVMSRIAWQKHLWVRRSFASSGSGAVLLSAVALLRLT